MNNALPELSLTDVVVGTAALFKNTINANSSSITNEVNNELIPAIEANASTISLVDAKFTAKFTNDVGDWNGQTGGLGTMTQRLTTGSKTHVGTEAAIEAEVSAGRVIDGDLCFVL